MNSLPLLLLLSVPAYSGALPAKAGDDRLGEEQIRLLDLAMERLNDSEGVFAGASSSTTTLPENSPEAIKLRFARAEHERAVIFDKKFGDGTFFALVNAQKGCLSKNGCDSLAILGLIDSAYKMVDLSKAPVPVIMARRPQILDAMKPFLNQLPKGTASDDPDAARRSKVLARIAAKVFTKSELERYLSATSKK